MRAGPPDGHVGHSVEHPRSFTERGISVAGGKQPGYALEFTAGPHTWTFECTSRDGGRITAWKLNGRNVLAEAKNLRLPHGSTFWPSPQRDWRWPPPEALDSRPYLVAFDSPSASITMDSVRDEALGLQLTKRYSIDSTLLAIRIDYSMLNTGRNPRSVAPWEVTRIPPGGTTFFRSASTRASSGPFASLPVARSSGATWFSHLQNELPGQHKLFDGCSRGWLAHLRHGLVFVKVFNRERPVNFAPGESEVQIYATAEYQELEQQGAYRTLAPGERYPWTVHWLLRPAPPSRGGLGRRTNELLEWVDELAGRVHSRTKA